MYQKMYMSNDYLYNNTFGEALNEWLITEETVVSLCEQCHDNER